MVCMISIHIARIQKDKDGSVEVQSENLVLEGGPTQRSGPGTMLVDGQFLLLRGGRLCDLHRSHGPVHLGPESNSEDTMQAGGLSARFGPVRPSTRHQVGTGSHGKTREETSNLWVVQSGIGRLGWPLVTVSDVSIATVFEDIKNF